MTPPGIPQGWKDLKKAGRLIYWVGLGMLALLMLAKFYYDPLLARWISINRFADIFGYGGISLAALGKGAELAAQQGIIKVKQRLHQQAQEKASSSHPKNGGKQET
ncbi:MAG: hypothetical protein AAFR61_00140 [Bacteroidota bacterium]